MQEFYERLRNPERYGPSQEEKDTCDAIVKTMLESYYTKANREELKRRIKKKEGYSVQYARGGESMLNGFYSRSLLTETVVSNVSRGKLLTRLTDKVPDYIYYFDEANRLSLVCRHPDTQYTEFTLVEISDDCEFTLGNFRAETNKEKLKKLISVSFILVKCVMKMEDLRNTMNFGFHPELLKFEMGYRKVMNCSMRCTNMTTMADSWVGR